MHFPLIWFYLRIITKSVTVLLARGNRRKKVDLEVRPNAGVPGRGGGVDKHADPFPRVHEVEDSSFEHLLPPRACASVVVAVTSCSRWLVVGLVVVVVVGC